MSTSPPEDNNQYTVCTLRKEGMALQDSLKLQTKMFSAATEKGTSWLVPLEMNRSKKPCDQAATASSL